MTVLAIACIFVLSALACHFIAKNRGADPVLWGVMGACFGPLAIPFAFLTRPKQGGGFSDPTNNRM